MSTLTENGGPEDICAEEPDRGPWMQTSRGGRFFPLDPRPEEIFVEDIANGLAQNGRYNGQRRIDRYYSIAEHSVLPARYAYHALKWPKKPCLAVLMHDSPEAYINDLNRATKLAMRELASHPWSAVLAPPSHYDQINAGIEGVIFEKFGIMEAVIEYAADIKELDQRIVANEKAAVMAPCLYPWAFDKFEPLPGVEIECWSPERAKAEFLFWFYEFGGKE